MYHAAGLGGYGGSSYIDAVILRDKDGSVRWIRAGGRVFRRVGSA